jgi:phosphomannomutase
MFERVARAHGVRCETTFTGFKWVWTAALELQREQGLDFVFGFEEALGYCVGKLVRDKDGISAAVVFAEFVAELADKGESVLDYLDELYRRHGLWVSAQDSIRREPPQGASEIAEALERVGKSEPSAFDGIVVVRKIDYREGAETRPRWRADDDLIQFDLEGGGRALVRPSGTEPLLKFYVDLPVEVSAGADVWAAEEPLRRRAGKIADELKALSGLAWPKQS